MTAPAIPTPEQAAAIAARAPDVLLEAGAGSGKTRVLVERYAAAVADEGADVGSILAFTFTERAAAELRQRIRRELARRGAEAAEPTEAARLRRAARDTERAWVMTIHAFCRRLLAAHPAAAGLDPGFRVIDEQEAERLRQRAMREAIAQAAADDGVAAALASYAPWRLARMALEAHARLRNLGEAEPALPEPVDGGEAELAAWRALSAVLAAFERRYRELKDARAGLDFSDLELGALSLLRGSAAIAAAWRERFAHVMVDEFQDTNRVQLELVEALRGPATRVFRVGDEHQSIYRFRNADLEVFREERRRAQSAPGAQVLQLRGNFRSLPATLAAVNFVGAGLLGPGFAPLTAGRPWEGEPGPAAELLLTLEVDPDGAAWTDEGIELEGIPPGERVANVAEARALARRLRELVDAGEARRGDIVVLLRAFTHVDAYEDALRRAGLDPYVVGGRGYWSQQQVEDLLRLLGCVANPLDDEILFGALASPACGVSPDALWLIRQAAGPGKPVWPAIAWRYGGAGEPRYAVEERWLEAIPGADAERLRSFCATLASLRAEAHQLPLDALVERTMDAFGYDLALLAKEQGVGRMANVRKLMRLARELEEHEGRDLRALLEVAEASTERDEREGMAPVQAEERDGVRVMTIHAAKGLEFPVVAVPDLGRRLTGGGSPDIAIGHPDASGRRRFGMRLASPAAPSERLWDLSELLEEEAQADAEEGCRLVYVAASRARDRLILSGLYKPSHIEASDPKPSQSALQRLLPELVELGWDGEPGAVAIPAPEAVPGAPAPPPATLRISVTGPNAVTARKLSARLAPPSTPGAAISGRPPIRPERPRPVPVGHLSYSALSQFERCGYRFYAERVIGLAPIGDGLALATAEDGDGVGDGDELADPAAGSPERARALGNAVHAALEWSALRGWRRPSPELLAALLGRSGLGGEAQLARRAAELVDGWLGSELRRELGGPLRPEAPFALPLDGTVVRGKMDLLAVAAGVPTVVDFKTDALRGSTPVELGERYAVQRAIYALAAAGSGGEARAIHCFLEAPDDPVVERFGPAELGAARERLVALVARIREGSGFAPAPEPYPALCFGCPAAPSLCSRPAWHPATA